MTEANDGAAPGPADDRGPWSADCRDRPYHSITVRGGGLEDEIWLSVKPCNPGPFPSGESVAKVVGALRAQGWEVDEWRGTSRACVLHSGDFRHDASLEVGGDFGGADERDAYARRLAERLSGPAAAPGATAVQLVDAVRLLSLLSNPTYESADEADRLGAAVDAGNRRYDDLRHTSFTRAALIARAEALAKLLGFATDGIEAEVDARIARQRAALRGAAAGRKPGGDAEGDAP